MRNETFQVCMCKFFNGLDFLVRSAQNIKKCTFLDNLRTITHEGNMETRLDKCPIFFIYFSSLTVFNIQFRIWKYSKFIFMWSSPWSILVCKIPQFRAESYRLRQLITIFQKLDTLRLQKIYIMFCQPARAKYPFF